MTKVNWKHIWIISIVTIAILIGIFASFAVFPPAVVTGILVIAILAGGSYVVSKL